MRILQTIRTSKTSKTVAMFLAILLLDPITGFNMLWASSGGPTQPEFSKYTAVGASDLVDPFTGNVGYSVPLFEMGGYPITLSYSGDINPEADAGWVGLGWGLNLGSVNRAMRGVPDDFHGDTIQRKEHRKPRWSVAGDFSKLKTEQIVHQQSTLDMSSLEELNTTMSMDGKYTAGNRSKVNIKQIKLGFTYDNYTGLGLSFDYSNTGNTINNDPLGLNTVNSSEEIAKARGKLISESIIKMKILPGSAIDIENEMNSDLSEMTSKFQTKVDYTKGFGFNTKGGFELFHNSKHHQLINGVQNALGQPISNVVTSFDGRLILGQVDGSTINALNAVFHPNFGCSPTIHVPVDDVNNRQYSLAFDWSKTGKLAMDKRNLSMQLDFSISRTAKNGRTKFFPSFGYLYLPNPQDLNFERGTPIVDAQEQGKYVDRDTRELPTASIDYDVFNISAAGIGGSFRAHQNNVVIMGPVPVKKSISVSGITGKVEVGSGPGSSELGVDLGVALTREKYQPLQGSSDLRLNDFIINYPNSSGIDISKKLKTNSKVANNNWQPLTLRNDFEFIENQKTYSDKFSGTKAISLELPMAKLVSRIGNRFKYRLPSGTYDFLNITGDIKKDNRDASQQIISYNTATTAKVKSFMPHIQCYSSSNGEPIIAQNANTQENQLVYENLSRVKGTDNNYRKGHHISEITVLQPDGTRYYFGTPVYATKQVNYLFNVSMSQFPGQQGSPNTYNYTNSMTDFNQRDKGQEFDNAPGSNLNNPNQKGVDEFSSRTEMPGYATTFLLNAVLSSDYVDKSGDGPSEDDLGNYVKFNYWQATHTAAQKPDDSYKPFKWRSSKNQADLNLGVKTDEQDDKASFSYGEKELWYAHSIETKDQIALFYLDKREDGYGILNENGGLLDASGPRQYYLKKVAIFTKEEFRKNGTNATPLKVVHLEYSYELCKNYAFNNNTGANSGKLTLKKVWFTYGKIGVPTSAPYVFNYDSNNNPDYAYKAVDRWGVYQPRIGASVINSQNSDDFPFTNQDNRNQANKNASAWMLKEIILPSGGKIEIEYEADDYAYVQDKEAMQMLKIEGISDKKDIVPEFGDADDLYNYLKHGANGNASGKNWIETVASNLRGKQFIIVKKPAGGSTSSYIKPGEMMYYNCAVKYASPLMPTQSFTNTYEPVNGFAEVREVGDIDGTYGYIQIKKERAGVFSVNPIFRMAVQQGLQKCPWVFYPSSGTKRYQELSAVSFVTAAVNSISDCVSMLTNKFAYFQMKHHCQKIDLNKSYVRVRKSDGYKVGGGHRVKAVTISDNWNAMSGEQSASYTLTYDYTKYDENFGKNISSGVASYEPFVGGEDNPNRMPKNVVPKKLFGMFGQSPSRTQKELKTLGPQSISYDLDPVGEEFYPSAIVGYSKVTIRTKYPSDLTGPTPKIIDKHKTGYTVQEFFTAKDFPARSERTELDRKNITLAGPPIGIYNKTSAKVETKENNTKTGSDPSPYKLTKLHLGVGASLTNSTTSQGFVIETNDMHGKPKANLVYTEGMNVPFSGSEYTYKTDQDGNLINNIDVIRENGAVENVEAGIQIEPVIFGSQSTSTTHTISPKLDYDQMGIAQILAFSMAYDLKRRTSRMITVTKHVRRSGLIDKVKVYDKGSAMVTKNLAWDAKTGQVLLTQIVNEHNDPIYNITKPAHWMYDGLKGAYNTIDMWVNIKAVNGSGEDTSKLLVPGDEFINRDEAVLVADHYWVLDEYTDPNTSKHYVTLIDKNGNIIANNNYQLRLIRGGKRNILGLGAESITVTDNPVLASGNSRKLVINPNAVIAGGGITYEDKRQVFERKDFCWSPLCGQLYNGGSWEPSTNGNYFGKMQRNALCNNSQELTNNNLLTSSVYISPSSSEYTINQKVNPFTAGIWGVWKPFGQYAYLDKRTESSDRTQSTAAGAYNPNYTDTRKDGKLKDYKEFWFYKEGKWHARKQQDTSNPWTWAGTIQYIDDRGNAYQTVNAIDTPTAALYAYNDRKLSTAMAVNAYCSDIVFDGFEEIPFDANLNFYCTEMGIHYFPWSNPASFNKTFGKQVHHWPVAELLIGNGNRVTDQEFHSGWKSLMLGKGTSEMVVGGTTLTSNANSNPLSEYHLQNSDFIPQFKTMQGKEYLISYWVKENVKNQFELKLKDFNLGLTITQTPVGKTYNIDGWKKVTVKFVAPGDKIKLEFVNTPGTVSTTNLEFCFLDDFRIQPVRSAMVAYVYDYKNYRMMAVLDDNNFASFFEYDEEGAMVRRKIETEKGVQTLQENRNSLRR